MANETFECATLEMEEGVCLLRAGTRDCGAGRRWTDPPGPGVTGDTLTGHGTHLELGDGRVDQRRLGHPDVKLLLLKYRRVVVHIPKPNVNLLVTGPEI